MCDDKRWQNLKIAKTKMNTDKTHRGKYAKSYQT